jgi:hypothetical protein
MNTLPKKIPIERQVTVTESFTDMMGMGVHKGTILLEIDIDKQAGIVRPDGLPKITNFCVDNGTCDMTLMPFSMVDEDVFANSTEEISESNHVLF